jgi:hypothetical protein
MDIPKKIINEVSDKMLENRVVMEDIAIVPNVFLIYLHRDNYDEIRTLLKPLREQIIVRLDKEISKRQKKEVKDLSRFSKMFEIVLGVNLSGSNHKIVVSGGWDISFETTDRDVMVGDEIFEIKRDEICVVASFGDGSVDASPDSLASHLKTFITIFKPEEKQPENFVVETAATSKGSVINKTNAPEKTLDLTSLSGSDKELASMVCQYSTGEEKEVFHITSPRVSVGRDPAADFTLHRASNRISRKHFEILYNEGRFYLENFGVYGTALQGRSVPISEKDRSNNAEPSDKLVEIPDKARISLAGGEVLIDFVKAVG